MFEKSESILAPVPRNVPWLLKIRIFFGGAINQAGWFFLGMGIFLVTMLDVSGSWWSVIRFWGPLSEANGEVLAREYTNIQENEQDLLMFRYRFRSAEGGEYVGESYATGSALQPGENVLVEYRSSSPQVSRIKGMRANKTSIWLSFLYLFPLVGMGLVIGGLKMGKKASFLMKNGELAMGRLIAKERTGSKVNNRRVYKLIFEFTALDGNAYNAVTKTHLTERVEDEAEERIIYDPQNPAVATVLDGLPTSPAIDSRGNFTFSSGIEKVKTLFTLIIPLLAILLNTINWQDLYWLLTR